MIDKAQVQRDQQEKIRLGHIAREFKDSSAWSEIIKPIIESIRKGLTDISSIESLEDLAGRKVADKYFQEFETLIDGFIIDADTVLSIAEKQKKAVPLFKTQE